MAKTDRTEIQAPPAPAAARTPPAPAASAPAPGVTWRERGRLSRFAAKLVHHAAWRLRLLEYAWEGVERELASTVRVPWHKRPGMWRRGFLSESRVLYGFPRDDWRDFLADYPRFVHTRLINGRHGAVLDDKLMFQRFLAGYEHLLPEMHGVVWRGELHTLDGETPPQPAADAVRTLADEAGTLALKPSRGGGGRGFHLLRSGGAGLTINGRHVDADALPGLLEKCDGHIVTEYVRQHPELSRLYPQTTNTVRVLTMVGEDNEPFVAAAVLRVGTALSDPSDNWIQGGLCAPIDIGSGRLGRAANYPSGGDRMTWHERHPDTGAQIEGTWVPRWARVAAGLLDVVREFPVFRYVGWDLVVTEGGFRIIEGNNYTGVNLFQIHRPLLADPRVAAFYRRHGVVR